MSAIRLLDIPYVRQQDGYSCGAAALSMVYGSLGIPTDQNEVWERLRAGVAHSWQRGTSTPNMARHLIDHHLDAVTLRAARPWEFLANCFSHGLRVIVIHRRNYDSPGLHCSVLRGLDETGVVLHDPNGRPDRRLLREDFLYLWGPPLIGCSAGGYELIAVARPGEGVGAPADAVPTYVVCPVCAGAIQLWTWMDPAPGTTWRELLCPYCHTYGTEFLPLA